MVCCALPPTRYFRIISESCFFRETWLGPGVSCNECSSLLLLNFKKGWSLSEKQGNETAPPRPRAQTWQYTLLIVDLLVSTSFSIYNINTSWRMCEITCLMSNSSGHVQDETAVLVANEVWGSEVGLHLQAAGATHLSQVWGKPSSSPTCTDKSQSWVDRTFRLPAALHFPQMAATRFFTLSWRWAVFKHQMSKIDFVILRKIRFFHC